MLALHARPRYHFSMSASANEQYWTSEALRVKRRINFAWWVERFNWLLVFGFLTLSVVVLTMRAIPGSSVSLELLLLLGGSLFLVASIAAWAWSRHFFIGQKEGLIRLDDQWSLNNRLISASAGEAPWPEIMSSEKAAAPPWRASVALLPSLIATLTLVAAWFTPVPEWQPDTVVVTSEPKSWDQVEDWIETLKEEDLIEPGSLDEIAGKIEELRQKPETEWYSHASLEASDTLKDDFGRDLSAMADDLAAMERSLDALTTFSTELSPEGREMLMKELSDALESLSANGLSLNEALAKQLSQLDPSQLSEATLKQMSAEELKQLQKQLGECSQCLGSMEGLPQLGESEQQMSFKPGTMPGSGGITRGKGDAPMFYGDEDDLRTNRVESVSNEDLSRAAIGDVIGAGETEHDDEMVSSGPQEGGAVESSGTGGDAVWKDSLLPDEQAVLKRYFK